MAFAFAFLMVAGMAQSALTQTPAPKPAPPPATQPSDRPFEIVDNSFIVEEAFNQEKGVFQNIFGFFRGKDDWDFAFTQEWPVRSQTHQLSFTFPIARGTDGEGVGDIAINYRYQVWLEEKGRPAFSPRLSVILPSGDADRGTGEGVVGWQVNLPFSKQRGDLMFHANGGLTILPGLESGPDTKVTLTNTHVGGSVIWRMKPMLNPMLETLARFTEAPDGDGGTDQVQYFTLSPGVRGGWNLGDHQLVIGFAVPVTWGGGSTDAGAFFYLSYELPFKR